jgi:mono/diheme cytochrome c family protein
MAAHAEARPAGFYRFVFDEYHSLSRPTLERAATPWKIIATALVSYHHERDPRVPLTEQGYVELLVRRYGFVLPARVANWPAGDPQPTFRRPLGIVDGVLASRVLGAELEVSNLGCATCHSAVLYDAQGNPTRDAWIGLPSSSIDLGRYGEEAYQALARAAAHPDETLALVRTVFPDVSDAELGTLRKFYLPRLRERMDELGKTIGALTPYSNGQPGLTNGVATLKLYLGVIDGKHVDPTQVAFTSVPDMGPLRARTSILWDGVYAPQGWQHTGPLPAMTEAAQISGMGGIVSAVTIGTMGVTPEVAAENVPRIREAVGWVIDEYRPPPFPGPIDATLAARGGALFGQHCARCHGNYAETPAGLRLASFPNEVIPSDVIETDATRADAVGADPNALFAKTALAPYLHARRTGGYVATALTSVWATAPYLHNGSIPTLWHLMHPEARPARFQVGGHRLDFARVGIDGAVDAEGVYRYPKGYAPWMDPDVYDTRAPGRSNAGHVEPFDELSEDDKRALLEFLKRV